MKKALIFILFYFLCNVNVFSIEEEVYSWVGDWKSDDPVIKGFFPDIPFQSKYLDGVIIIYNKKPDRDIHYEIINDFGYVYYSSDIKAENSSILMINISELPIGENYTIVITSSYPSDKVSSCFRLI